MSKLAQETCEQQRACQKIFSLACVQSPIAPEGWPGRSSSEATQVDDAAIVRAHCDLEPARTTPGTIDEEASAAIYPSDVPKAAIAQDLLTLTARDRAAIAEVGSDIDVYRDGMSGRRRRYGDSEAEGQTKAGQQKMPHRHAFPDITAKKAPRRPCDGYASGAEN
ncbi:hypothetical protein GCM10007276_35430 [Agaricicola taiwanensis]|uniref:Uncharacterized protein n=1 Tax=Agaricicola taiwanensis TaxID=591372 RepID=A0A8J3E0R9_9RHOB|nr:hypothetical protein [Agaricicola taiwanensis]GGE55321.1 hypothetical protein GCM10007276_35430 [Agaricicola taiwanensis]